MQRRNAWLGLAIAAVAACSGGSKGSGSTPINPAITTRGRVLFRNAQPPSTASVRATGCADQDVAADGSFDTTCASATFDVAVNYANVGLVYQGLTRRDPLLTLPFALGGPEGGSTSGAATGLTPGRAAAIAVTTPAVTVGFAQTADGTFSDYLMWKGSPPAATVRVLEWTPASGLPSAFTGYGATAVTLQDGSDVPASPALGSVGNGTITVTSDAPDTTALTYDLWATWPDGGVTLVTGAAPPSTETTVATPDVAGAAFTVVAERGADPTSWGWRRGLSATSAPPRINLPAPAVFTAPSPGATVDGSTDFTIGGLSDAVYLVAFEASGGTPLLYVVTTATTVRIPDFSWAGLTLPAATSLTARVYAMGPCASVDDAAASAEPMTLPPPAWAAANRIPSLDGFATLQTMTVATP